MSKLKCEDQDCRHNCYLACDKQCIVLDDDAVCCSFQKRTLESIQEEFASEKLSEYSDVETAINCNEETCYFNRDNFCKASEVKIDSDAWCTTYRKK
ncbi:MAG: hypothetical protein MR270_05640 [Erysipelotrichaceae bacterium]|nr:hypothetical protein [Erysipelotrichaceae bacterium]